MPWRATQGGWRGRLTQLGRDSARVRRRGLAIAITQRVRCGRLGERSTERMSRTPLGRRPPTRGARSPARHPPRLRGSVAVRNALPRLAHGRRRLCHPGPARRRLRAAAPTAESGRVVRSNGPRGPRHRRSRLRHGAHRRGDASAASRPPQAHACVVEKVCLSAQPPADRSVQRLIRRRHWTAPAHCWAARHHSCPPSARQRARTDTAPCLTSPPPRGLNKEGTGAAALCPCRCFLLPLSPL